MDYSMAPAKMRIAEFNQHAMKIKGLTDSSFFIFFTEILKNGARLPNLPKTVSAISSLRIDGWDACRPRPVDYPHSACMLDLCRSPWLTWAHTRRRKMSSSA